MPRLVHQSPTYRKHKASGQAVVTLNGDDVYLGDYGTKASRDKYDRVIGEWLATGRRRVPSRGADVDVVEVLNAYRKFARDYYDGPNSGELHSVLLALKVVNRLYGPTPAADFGPLAMRAVRDEMVKLGWSRKYVNAQVGRVRRMFKWAVERELVPPSVLLGLQAVAGLRQGKTEAPESQPVMPVAEEHVNATLPHLSRQVCAMVELQRLTGMRPGEVCAMRSGDILAVSETVWEYRPASHKTKHRGHDRVIYLGPRAIELLRKPDDFGRRWIRTELDAPLFQPAESEVERRAARSAARKTPLSCGNRPGTNRRRRPRRGAAAQYSVAAYRRAIARACELAFGMPMTLRKRPKGETADQKAARLAAARAWRSEHCWHPHQLRHTAATNLRREYGLEAAQVILGHKTLTVTQVYAEKNVQAARRIMGEVG